jgi:hypothetical protein
MKKHKKSWKRKDTHVQEKEGKKERKCPKHGQGRTHTYRKRPTPLKLSYFVLLAQKYLNYSEITQLEKVVGK